MKRYIQKMAISIFIILGVILCVSCARNISAYESEINIVETTTTKLINKTETSIEIKQTEEEITPTSLETTSEVIYSSLYTFLLDLSNGKSVGDVAVKLNNGEWHNACVYVVSEALRNTGYDIAKYVNRTEVLVQELEKRGFDINYDLTELQPGDICFTTDEQGNVGGRPTHTYIFLGWESTGVANVFDNQKYDYGSLYHTRSVELTFFNSQADRPKEATAFFMRK